MRIGELLAFVFYFLAMLGAVIFVPVFVSIVGVIGSKLDEAGVAALYHNLGTQYVEYEACQGGVAIPYSLHTNPTEPKIIIPQGVW